MSSVMLESLSMVCLQVKNIGKHYTYSPSKNIDVIVYYIEPSVCYVNTVDWVFWRL